MPMALIGSTLLNNLLRRKHLKYQTSIYFGMGLKWVLEQSRWLIVKSHLKLVLVALKSLHHHTHSFHGALETAVHAIKAVHAARDVR